ncbi:MULTISPECIES: FxLD family lanthipeptide [Streptomyces]
MRTTAKDKSGDIFNLDVIVTTDSADPDEGCDTNDGCDPTCASSCNSSV